MDSSEASCPRVRCPPDPSIFVSYEVRLTSRTGLDGSNLRSSKVDTQQYGSEQMTADGSGSSALDGAAIARAAAANAAAMSRNSSAYQSSTAAQSTITPSSPKSSFSEMGGSLNVRKGVSSLGKRVNSMFRGSSTSESAEIVREQYISVRNRCQREMGASMSHNVLDTSLSDLHEWIRNERLTTLPHKGGSWDRVLISAHHFAEQVCRLSEAIENFAPESGVASNLVFGQCLLLLEKVSILDHLVMMFVMIQPAN